MDPLFEIELAPAEAREAIRGLQRQLEAAIVEGRLRPGMRLPATRRAMDVFRVSRNTVVEAYERLALDGYVVARRGSGYYVAESIPRPARPARASDALADPRLRGSWSRPDVAAALGYWDDPRPPDVEATIDFRPALVDARLFPFDAFRRVLMRALRDLERRPGRNRGPRGNQGSFVLRDAISRHVALTRGIACAPDDVVVTAGAQQAFDLVARVLVAPGTVVAVEDPGYPPMRVPFIAAGATVVPVPVDEEGLRVDGLPDDAQVICLCPSHQFPLGITMSARRRRALVAFARERGAVIVEDDYDGEYRLEGGSLDALRTADDADVVVYVGTFSKCLLPSLRLGFMIAPPWAIDALVTARNATDWHGPVPMQLGIAAFIDDGHLARHVRRMRRAYAERRARLVARLHDEFSAWLVPVASSYGMHVTALARAGVDVEAIARSVADDGVRIHTLHRYHPGPEDRTGLVFGYGAADVRALDRGLDILRAAFSAPA